MKLPARSLRFAALAVAILCHPFSVFAQQDTGLVATDSIVAVPDTAPVAAIVRTVAVEEATVPGVPLPSGSRITMTRDSILWSRAVTLADLLAEIPGVYVARAGFLGQPEYVQYGGRGGSALEVYWDGLPWEPVGGDSLFVDPGRIPLTYLRRIDIEVLPSVLRVFLVSERYELLKPRSKVRIMSGAFETAAYAGLFQQRWPSGLGIDLAADFVGTEGVSDASGSDQLFDVWAKVSWLPKGALGASYQLRRQQNDRPEVSSGAGINVPARQGTRTDMIFSLFSQSSDYRLGLRADGGVAVSRWESDSGSLVPDQEIRRAYAGLRYTRNNLSATLRAQVADARTSARLEGRFGWVPKRGLVMAGDVRWMRHDAGRTSRLAHASAGVYRGPFSLTGEIAWQDAFQAPTLLTDTAIATTDRALRAEFRTRVVEGSVALVRRDAFQALSYPDLGVIASTQPSGRTTYLVTALRLRSSSALSFGVWYSDAVDNLSRLSGDEPFVVPADLQPPTHARADITLRSKYWRTFRSGAFDFMLQVAMESWSTGTAGLDAQGVVVTLPGATFYHVFLQFRVVSFTAFWDFRNARLTEAEYVPGLAYPRQAQTFGVTWEFRN